MRSIIDGVGRKTGDQVSKKKAEYLLCAHWRREEDAEREEHALARADKDLGRYLRGGRKLSGNDTAQNVAGLSKKSQVGKERRNDYSKSGSLIW